MTSKEIRQSFFDFFESKQHTIVKSGSLLPDAPNLLFTNAGMNQFVPIFLGQANCPYTPGRAADTQKCIRAGGKHNDLEDVGADTYHHTFFEMLGNWSFGDYFKKEAIDWAWELITDVWGFPKERLYATYFGGDEKSEADLEAKEFWLRYLPAEQVVPGNRKDNFWQMGDTGPCGPCSELHVDLTPEGNCGPGMVNADSADCIEIWNLVFIQFNANADGTFAPLPAKHVDTGMGFERACSIIQCTKNFTDFSGVISNYETDVFSPIFRTLEEMSGKTYGSAMTDPVDIAFRVIADHIRCLAFSIADGIIPSNEGRGYVLRRILRRAVRTGRILGFKDPFFYKLTDIIAETYGDVFPELRNNQDRVKKILKAEEDSFNRTLDRGIVLFDQVASGLTGKTFPAEDAFKLYDTFGFPLDLTEVMARERGIAVDAEGFEKLMNEQRKQARADHANKKSVVLVEDENLDVDASEFVGYEFTKCETEIVEVLESGAIMLKETPFYPESGGQQGDHGEIKGNDFGFKVTDTQKTPDGIILHIGEMTFGAAKKGEPVLASVDRYRRGQIRRNHTSTHLLNAALREVVDGSIKQAGSMVASDYLRFDFNYFEAIKPEQLRKIEQVVNHQILRNTPLETLEMSLADVQKSGDIQAVFDDKYGETVRVVNVGNFSKELCGGTHVEATGDIGQFRIVSESSVAAGVRRIEAVTGMEALAWTAEEHELLSNISQSLSVKPADLPERIKAMAEQAKAAEKQLKELQMKAAVSNVDGLADQVEQVAGFQILAADLGEMPMDALRQVLDRLRQKIESAVIVLGSASEGKACLAASVSDDLVAKGVHAGKLIGAVAKIAGGGGGGKPDKAQAGGKDGTKVAEAIAAVTGILNEMHG
ncbi:alanine--tRNA ligase [Pontiella sulfatireligans]|uniref:Alanine--tRNA ligase n=1 Tax=Pontiella sulfatireligans TaxID=2750658 RepID=A0A6C2UTH5_9BACT|nr:alanine--tRNA ligase [Pontiella sulfatireligans]VGO22591.1 Alanine--tRNA ligase [Pontiella sulfatireligans]